MLNPITALVALRPLDSRPAGQAHPQPPGEALQPGSGVAAERLTQGAQGLPLPVGSARTGDLLLMQVVATQPQIELQLLEHRPAALAVGWRGAGDSGGAVGLEEATPALRSDQAWLQRLHLGAVPATAALAALAAQWRSRVQAELLRNLPAPDLPRAAGGGPGAAMASGIGTATPAELLALAAPLYSLPGWNQMPVLLRLLSPAAPAWPHLADELPPGGEGEADAPFAKQGAELAAELDGLRLQLSLTLVGDVVHVLLQWQHGLLLYFAAESASALQRLRQQLPQLASALASVPLPLRYCLFGHSLPIGQRPALRPGHGLVHSSSVALFRAAAEIVAVLQQS